MPLFLSRAMHAALAPRITVGTATGTAVINVPSSMATYSDAGSLLPLLEVRHSCNEEDAQLEDQRKSTEAKLILHSQPHSA